ncbi:MAG: D-3-phosphoglycerate dehydrogenase [Paenibacillaceae bacterium]|jgi:D-3-phosphoglycerate dehydrogenase|nr:D-3-phosphoglycerate dehydrogenase [Paenibacillaceae bacterium]
MYKVLVLDGISDQGVQLLKDAQGVQVDIKPTMPEDVLLGVIGEYDAVMVRSQTKVNARVMEAGKNLKVVGRAGVGVDNIDLDAATQRGIVVVNAPDGNTIATCELTFAHMMGLARMIPQAYKKTVAGEWDRKTFVGVELRNKVLGIIGMGRIGSEVAKRAKVFGMEVIGFDPFMTEERADKIGVTLGTVDDIVRKSDFITVHTPLTNDTRNIISRPQFEVMKKGARIINCARGGIIDEAALVEAIDSGIVAGAAFDVFTQEPPAADHPFLNHPKIIVTPHLGASTVEAQENVAVDVSEEVLHILLNEPFKNAVNMPSVPEIVLKKLQPYFNLGEKLGKVAGQLAGAGLHEISINYSGELSDVDVNPLTRYIVLGVLSNHLGDEANVVNAMHLAKAREINIVVQKSSAAKSFTNLVTVTLKTDNEVRVAAGTLLAGYGERIVQIDQYPVDIAPEGHVLFIAHNDKPGIIGKVGTLLGDNGVNIATMQVGRKVAGGDAIMLLTIDKQAADELLAALKALPEITTAKEIRL